jgi:hypothetical protein
MKRESQHGPTQPDRPKLRYEPPRIVAYDESALLDMIGPAGACARWPGSAPPRRGDRYDPDDYEDF